MAPPAPILRIGSSLSGAPTAAPTASLPAKPAASSPPPPPFDRASAFKERLQATQARATAAASLPSRPSAAASASSSASNRAAPPRPAAVQQPVAAALPPAAAQPSPYSNPSLVYPISGPRTTSGPPAPSSSSPSSFAPASPPFPPRQPAYGAFAYPDYAPQQHYPHHMPSTATPFHLPSHPHHHPAQPHPSSAFPHHYAVYPPTAPASSHPAYPPPSTAHDTQTWPAPEITWRSPPPPAPPVPARLTSDGRETDYGAAAAAAASGGGEEQGAAQEQQEQAHQEQQQARAQAHEPASPRARRRSTMSAAAAEPGSERLGGFVSAFEGEFGGAERAREGAFGLCGLEGLEEAEGERLEGELLRVWRDKIAPLSNGDLDDASRNVLDGLHYLLLTSPSLPSLPSSAQELSSLELALLDVAIRAEGLDVADERDAVRERWGAVERKWTARTTRVLALEDRQAGIVSALVQKVAELELERAQAQARTKRLETSVAASKGELEQQKERAERAEAKVKAKPSQRVGLLLEDLKKVTAARDTLSAELDDARSTLASAHSDLARLRRPSSALLLSSTTRTSTALDHAASEPSAAAADSTGEPGRALHLLLLEAELRRAREAHEADRMIADERVRALRAEADELRRVLARRASASASAAAAAGGGAGAPGASVAGSSSLVGAAVERELESAKAQLAKKGFVVTRLAEKVKELNRELEGKARENATLLDRLAVTAPRASSASSPASP
ncbi:uncharacterized protein RHOBADRAFT_47166 [Rhodotorula graminis WP1]|uniref:Uncharacterized protein n=1 Tax=Rhodotorula graminis (strain WP1) TaxID=578459 RepID=A0A0P9F8J8_RHOGW|nr:uncharacterized protein RHOBADRAFT_47166 [Rhodotorula graminis WP1]KPV71984.1 hypothetical protein RHOBADRAFT_47166 [Rhodotorula graminis WP1]